MPVGMKKNIKKRGNVSSSPSANSPVTITNILVTFLNW